MVCLSAPGFLCTQIVAGERKHLQDGLEFIEIDLLCCLLQLTSLAYTSKPVFLLYPSFLSVSLSIPAIHPLPSLGHVSTVEQAADSMVTSVEDGRMRGSGGREGVERGRRTNERDSSSRGLSLHLQITAPPTLFDICPK